MIFLRTQTIRNIASQGQLLTVTAYRHFASRHCTLAFLSGRKPFITINLVNNLSDNEDFAETVLEKQFGLTVLRLALINLPVLFQRELNILRSNRNM